MASAFGTSSSGGGDAPSMIMDGSFTIERLSGVLFKVVEADRFGQLPFFFVIVGPARIAVIDTGTGSSGDVRALLDKHINPGKLPYCIINTHNHYDHVGGNGFFGSDTMICMGDRHKVYSRNLSVTSLAGGVGWTVRPFEVTRWLGDGDTIEVDDGDSAFTLQALHIPGHAVDHIAVYWPAEKRLFVGDTIYPFTAIDLCNMGAQPAEYVRSLAKLATLVADENAAPARGPVLASASAPEAVTPLPTESESDPRIAALVVGRLGMDLESAAAVFDAHRLLYDVCHGDLDRAAELVTDLGDSIDMVAPPQSTRETRSESAGFARDLPVPRVGGACARVTLACGHVDHALDASEALEELASMVDAIRHGTLSPSRVDTADGTAEYASGRFALILPTGRPIRWES